MAYEACITAIKQAAGEDLSDEDMAAILDEIIRRKNIRRKVNPLEGEDDAIDAVAKELAEEERIAALIEKRNRLINIRARNKRFAFYNNQQSESFAISTLNVGSERAGEGFGHSADAQAKALESELIGPMVAELRRDGLLDILKTRDEAFERDVARELYRVSGGGGEPTGNKLALRAAEILNKYQDESLRLQNAAGAFIRKLPGYIVRQSHDTARIARAGPDAWKEFTLPRLDERAFADTKDRDGFLKAVYFNLASGNHLKSEGAADWLGGFKGPGNLAKRVSQERVLDFKDADAWYDYNKEFGSGSLLEAALHGIQRGARNAALMRVWGTNPEAAFQADLDRLVLKAKERGDLKEVKALTGWLIRSEFDQVTGQGNIAGNPSLAVIGANVRAVKSMASLGGVVLTSIPDIAIRAASLRHHGIGLLESYDDGLKSLLRGRGKGEVREIADLINVGTQGMLGSVVSRFDAQDSVRGKMSKAMDLFFRLNLLSWWTDSHMTGVGLMLSHNLARNAGKGFDALHPSLKVSLTRFGITEAEWNVIRKSEIRDAEGRSFITPDAIRRIDDTAGLDRAELESKLRAYFVESAREAMTFGGARERAITTFGTRPGTPMGEAVRFIMQFKTFPITFATRHMTREFKREGVDKIGLAHLIVATTAMGYLAMGAKDIAKGKEPRDPRDAKTWFAAMQQGGGLGIYGDFLFGKYNRFGGGLIETAAGPTAGTLNDLGRIFGALKEGDDASAQAVRAAIGNTPFANLFYTRMALDHMILYQVQEMLNPGYLRRMERRIEKDTGQKFIIAPSRNIPRGGGGRLFEGIR